MEYTLQQKYKLMKEDCLKSISKNPIEIAREIMNKEYMNIHGPEHHFLDGASFLTAYKNAGGKIDLPELLNQLKKRTIRMPGGICGHWGVCGSVTSLGASLALINETGPLTDNVFYKDNMEYTAKIISIMARIGGPRCCKRNAFLSILNGIKFVREKYNVEMELSKISCEFTNFNEQCIKERCPFYRDQIRFYAK